MEISHQKGQISLTTKTAKTRPMERKLSEPTTHSPLQTLLRKDVKALSAVSHRKERKVDGVLIGVLIRLDAQGRPLVSAEQIGVQEIPARSLASVCESDCGKAVALGFEAGNPDFPIILGFMQQEESAAQINGSQVAVHTQDGRVVVSAEDELELRCGEAVILMQSDGRITLRGQYITSHASAGQRIRGGSVQIN